MPLKVVRTARCRQRYGRMSKFKSIYCVVKRTEFEYHHSSDQRRTTFCRLSQAKRDRIRESHDNQVAFIGQLKQLAVKLGLPIGYVSEDQADRIDPGAEDLVLSCGGDGNFLSCAQRFPNSILLGMNSDYQTKVGSGSYGALTTTNRINLERHLNDLLIDRYFIDRWSRLQVMINGQRLERFAVNDIYFGQEISYQTCNITVLQSGIEEEFNCSGLLCCTGMGSHAWHYNAGGSPFSNELDAFGFRVLFPNLKWPLKFSSGIVSSRNELIMYPDGDGYILSFDSKPDVITTELGDEIRISLAPQKAVRVISFHNGSD
jgi:NAD kinase